MPSGEFPLASSLPSTTSAAGSAALFGGFPGTTELSDFPRSFIIGVRPWTSRCGLRRSLPQSKRGISRFPGEMFPCMLGVSDRAGSRRASRWRRVGCGLPLSSTASAPRSGVMRFRGSIPGLHVPLSTLRRRPYGRRRMTRGRCGSLLLHRMTLSFTTPRRFDRRTEGTYREYVTDEQRRAPGCSAGRMSTGLRRRDTSDVRPLLLLPPLETGSMLRHLIGTGSSEISRRGRGP